MRYSSRRKVPPVSSAPKSRVPAEYLAIVHQLRDLTVAGRLSWDESRTSQGFRVVAVSLASGRWQLAWNSKDSVRLGVWDDEGTSIFRTIIGEADPSFAEITELRDTAIRKNREKNASRTLAKMREELATR